MTVLAYRVKEVKDTPLEVPQINPSYNTLNDVPTLGKQISPQPLTTSTDLPQGIHLHFVLPSALKHGVKKAENATIEYPPVPDKFIITRMYVKEKDGKKIIVNDCNIVDSSFYSMENKGCGVTIPFLKDDTKPYRYLGRQYSGFESKPELNPDDKEGYLDEHYAIGPGDPLFNAYYPNCRGVFGYYDDLANVPDDAALTYSVIGYYSKADKDPFSKVDSKKSMKQILSDFKLSTENDSVCNSCLLFGEVCDINLSDNDPWFTDKIVNMGIGRTTTEALSAIIKGKYAKEQDNDLERKLTTILYGMADEVTQIDGNHKIDDSIHSYGFTSNTPFEIYHEVIFPKDVEFEDPADVLSKFDKLNKEQINLGYLRRELEYKKNILYNLWEKYVNTSKEDAKKKLQSLITITIDRINSIRTDKFKTIESNIENKLKPDLEEALSKRKKKKSNDSEEIKIDESSAKPFYVPKDPAVMLFGDAVNTSFASLEEEGLEEDNTLYCLTSPLSCNVFEDIKALISRTDAAHFKSSDINDGYVDFLIMTVILDKINIIPKIGINNIKTDGEPSENMLKVMVNNDPKKEHTLFMEWQTNFYNDYDNCNYDNINESHSTFLHGHTDYTYSGEKRDDSTTCFGISVLTPHGVYNLEEKLKKYGMDKIAEEIKGLPALSQNLGGFTINLSSLSYVFQLPMNFKDDVTKSVRETLEAKNEYYAEEDSERLAIEGTSIIPLREGFLNFENFSITTSFGNQTKPIDESAKYQMERYFSENLYPIINDKANNVYCFLPLALTTPARLSSYFISAANENIKSCSLPGSSPIIAIIMPDMLNRNLNIYDSNGMLIGILKRVFRNIDKQCNGSKTAVGRFMRICSEEDYDSCDNRIQKFIKTLTGNNSYLSEVMNCKLSNTIPMNENDFIFGRILVLAEMNIELEYYGGTQVAININSDKILDDKGLSEKEFSVMIGDIERVTDGVICGFYGDNDDFENGFAAFGYEAQNNKHLNATHPKICGSTPDNKVAPKKITLLLDPMQKVTLSTGILPVEQIQINASHTDFNGMNLMSTEMNTLISEKKQIQVPDFIKNDNFTREYPTLENDKLEYKKLDVVKETSTIGTIDKTFITDGFIVKNA